MVSQNEWKDSADERQAGRRQGRRQVRRSLPMVLLLLSLAAAGVGAIGAHDAHRANRTTAETLLNDYGAMAAWSFTNRWRESVDKALDATLSTAFNAAIQQAADHQCLSVLLVERSHEDCRCAGTLAGPSSWAFLATITGDVVVPMTEGPAPPEDIVMGVLDRITESARAEYGTGGRAFRLVRTELPGDQSRLFAVAITHALSGDSIFYGLEVDSARFVRTLEEASAHPELLPPSLTGGRPIDELVAITLTAPGGREVYASSPDAAVTFPAEQPLPDALGGGVVRASVLPEAADDLIIGGLPGNRTPLLLLIFGLAGGLAVIAVFQLRKEEAFARERHDFVAGVSHELRTPLAQIRLFVETLRLGRFRTNGERDWALENVNRESLRLTRLVENILHFSRADRDGFGALDLVPVDLADHARAVVDSFRPLVRPEKAHLLVEVPDGITVELDNDPFRQVLLNLLDNAVKFGPAGQTVRVHADRIEDRVRLTVTDEGPGIPPTEQEVVFQPFRRGSESIGSVTTGSGIGLNVVRQIVRAHGGRVWLEDGPDDPETGEPVGARAVVELPLLRTALPPRLEVAGDGVTSGAA